MGLWRWVGGRRGFLRVGGGMEYATVEANDVALAVRIFRPPWDVERKRDVTVVMAHQYSVLGGCQALLKGTAAELARRGFTTLTFDMRGAGRSSGRPSLTGFAEVQDVIAVCQWATQHLDAQSILLVGNSAGNHISTNSLQNLPFSVTLTMEELVLVIELEPLIA